MTSTPDEQPHDLDALREEIDELKDASIEELVDPAPKDLVDALPEATPSDAIGSEKCDEPASDEVTDL